MFSFPEGFLWGASLSAHQAEGGNFASDWWRWEQRPGRIRDGATSARAAGHFEQFERDFALAGALGHNAHLLSIAWSRVQPAADRFDDAALAHYGRVLDTLVGAGIEPVCALHCVATPAWFAQQGGWTNPRSPGLFAQYARRILADHAGKCRWWIPIYEPLHGLNMAYVERVWPPASRNLCRAVRALRNMARAHLAAYGAIHEARADALVGVAIRGRRFRPEDPDNAWDLRVARRETHRCCHGFLRAVRKICASSRTGAGPISSVADFLGVGYCGIETIRFAPLKPFALFAEVLHEKQGATPDAEGFRALLDELAAYGLPMLITGNGIATGNDAARCEYILGDLAVVQGALGAGVDVRGYIYRSLLDQFEWHEGYRTRFGLVHVDRETLARTPNPSAYLYKDICEHGGVRRGAVAKFCPEWGNGKNSSGD